MIKFMNIISGVKIKKIKPVKEKDKRGPTYEWCRGLPGRQVSVYIRKKGSRFGEHYHEGADPSKDPELLFLAKGRIEFQAVNPQGQEMKRIIKGGQELKIYPGILHWSRALTEVVFVEYRSIVYDKKHNDTYPAASYDKYLKHLR